MPMIRKANLPYWRIFYALLLGLGLPVTGCSKTNLPPSDPTPPSLIWNVYNHNTQTQSDYPGSPKINVKRGEAYRVVLKANNPGGVKSISVGGEISWLCTGQVDGRNLGQNTNNLLAPISQDLAPNPDGTVLTSIFLIQEMDFNLDCQAGFHFTSGSATLSGQASNYYGKVTNEVIAFNIAP